VTIPSPDAELSTKVVQSNRTDFETNRCDLPHIGTVEVHNANVGLCIGDVDICVRKWTKAALSGPLPERGDRSVDICNAAATSPIWTFICNKRNSMMGSLPDRDRSGRSTTSSLLLSTGSRSRIPGMELHRKDSVYDRNELSGS
jgi:hypothetical protein